MKTSDGARKRPEQESLVSKSVRERFELELEKLGANEVSSNTRARRLVRVFLAAVAGNSDESVDPCEVRDALEELRRAQLIVRNGWAISARIVDGEPVRFELGRAN